MIRLLEPVCEATNPDAPQFVVLGKKWTVCDYATLSEAPEYTCVSYAWGEERTENPFSGPTMISARAVRALETAIIATKSQATWAKNIRFDQNSDPTKEHA